MLFAIRASRKSAALNILRLRGSTTLQKNKNWIERNKIWRISASKKTARELLLVLTNLGQAPISLHYLSIQLREVFVKIFAKRKGDYLTAAAAANEAKHLMKLYF